MAGVAGADPLPEPMVQSWRGARRSTPVWRFTQKRSPASSVSCSRGRNGPQGRAPPGRSPRPEGTTATTGSSSCMAKITASRPTAIGSATGMASG